MPACAIVGCSKKYRAGEKVRLFYLPKVITNQCNKTHELSSKRKAKWLSQINRNMTGKKVDGMNVRVCNRHFVSGKPSALFDYTHPDWAPTLHLGYEGKKIRESDVSRYPNLQERRLKNRTILPSLQNQPGTSNHVDDSVNILHEAEVKVVHSSADFCQGLILPETDENARNVGQFEHNDPHRSSTDELTTTSNPCEQLALEVVSPSVTEQISRRKTGVTRTAADKNAQLPAIQGFKNGLKIKKATRANRIARSTLQKHVKELAVPQEEKLRQKKNRASLYPESILEAVRLAVERREITVAGSSRLLNIPRHTLYKIFRKQRLSDKPSPDRGGSPINGADQGCKGAHSSLKWEGGICERTENCLFTKGVERSSCYGEFDLERRNLSVQYRGSSTVREKDEIREQKPEQSYLNELVKRSDDVNEPLQVKEEHEIKEEKPEPTSVEVNYPLHHYHTEFEIKEEPHGDVLIDGSSSSRTDLIGGQIEKARGKLDKANQDLKDLQTKLSNLEGLLSAKICSLETDNAALKLQLSAKESDLAQAHAMVEALTADNDQLTEDNTKLSSELECAVAAIENLQEQNETLTTSNNVLRSELIGAKEMFAQSELGSFRDNSKVKFYTGFPSYTSLLEFFALVSSSVPHSLDDDFPKSTEFLFTMMRLHLGLREEDLGYRFNSSALSISKICEKWVVSMSDSISEIIDLPHGKSFEAIPCWFRKLFGNRLAVIIDCFEVLMGTSPLLLTSQETSSLSANKNLIKFNIGIALNGKICFVSDVEVTDLNDTLIPSARGLFDRLAPGDLVFTGQQYLLEKDSGLYQMNLGIQAYTKGETQLTIKGADFKKDVEKVREYVERVIGSVRGKFRLLGGMLPASFLSYIPEGSGNRSMLERLVRISCAQYNVFPSDAHDHDYSVRF